MTVVGVAALDANVLVAFAMRLWDASAADVDEVVRHLIATRRRRPVTPAEMSRQLGAHFPSMSAAWLAQADPEATTPGRGQADSPSPSPRRPTKDDSVRTA